MRNLRALNLVNEAITVADSALLEPLAGEAWSLLIWFKLNGSVPTQDLINKADLYGYSMGVNASDKLSATITDTNEDSTSITGGTTLVTDKWYLGIVTLSDAGKLNLYLNGVSDATEVSFIGTGDFSEAKDMVITGSSYNGLLGEVQLIVGHALSATEALDLYNRGTSKGLKGNYGKGDVRLWLRWKNRITKDNSGYENVVTGAIDGMTDRVRLKDYR